MHTLRPPAGASLAHYARLIGGALALALTCAGNTLGAQTFTTNLRGYVRSSAGAPVADAQVVARDVETNQRRATTTNATGYYYIGGLRPGQYLILEANLSEVKPIAQYIKERALGEGNASPGPAGRQVADLRPEHAFFEIDDQAIDAAELEISPEDRPNLISLVLNDEQLAVLEFIAERHHAADPQSFALRGGDLVADSLGGHFPFKLSE